MGPHHTEDLWALHQDEAVAAWHGGRWSKETAHKRAAASWEAWRTVGVDKWMAYRRTTGELVGRGGLSRMTIEGEEELEVGWTVRSDFWGQGYATEMGLAALSFAFNELRAERVVAFTEPHNSRSRAVMERLGMRYTRDIVHEGAEFVLYTVKKEWLSTLPQDEASEP